VSIKVSTDSNKFILLSTNHRYKLDSMRATEGVLVYTYHSRTCPDRDKGRFWRECDCKKWITGNLPNGEPVERQSTGETDWHRAEAIRNAYVAEHMHSAAEHKIHGITIRAAVEQFLRALETRIEHDTLRAHRHVLNTLTEWCSQSGIVYMSDLTVARVEDFKTGAFGEIQETTRAVYVDKLRVFLKEAHRLEWTADALHLRVPRIETEQVPVEPFTTAEVEKLIAAATNPMRLLIELLAATGMRIGDALQFHRRLCFKGVGDLWVYEYEPDKQRRTKRKKQQRVYLPHELFQRLTESKNEKRGRLFPWTQRWALTLFKALCDQCGIADGHFHRFRHSFVTSRLEDGWALEDVSKLAGHADTTITARVYAKWTNAREDRLQRMVAERLMNSAHDAGGNGQDSAPAPADAQDTGFSSK
jgi:integrase